MRSGSVVLFVLILVGLLASPSVARDRIDVDVDKRSYDVGEEVEIEFTNESGETISGTIEFEIVNLDLGEVVYRGRILKQNWVDGGTHTFKWDQVGNRGEYDERPVPPGNYEVECEIGDSPIARDQFRIVGAYIRIKEVKIPVHMFKGNNYVLSIVFENVGLRQGEIPRPEFEIRSGRERIVKRASYRRYVVPYGENNTVEIGVEITSLELERLPTGYADVYLIIEDVDEEVARSYEFWDPEEHECRGGECTIKIEYFTSIRSAAEAPSVEIVGVEIPQLVVGETGTINIELRNTGGVEALYKVVVDAPGLNILTMEQGVSIPPEASKMVSFVAKPIQTGVFEVRVDVRDVNDVLLVSEKHEVSVGGKEEPTPIGVLSSVSIYPTVAKAGGEVTIQVYVENRASTSSTYRVKVSSPGLLPPEQEKQVTIAAGGTAVVTFKVTVAELVGEQTLVTTLIRDSTTYDTQTQTFTIGEAGTPRLVVVKTVSPTTVRVGGMVTTTIEIRNEGEARAKEVSVEDSAGNSFSVEGSTKAFFPEIAPKESKRFVYMMKALKEGSVVLPEARVTYLDDSGKTYSTSSNSVTVVVTTGEKRGIPGFTTLPTMATLIILLLLLVKRRKKG